MDAIHTLCAHVIETRYSDLPHAAVDAAKRFVLDSLGVGLYGSNGPFADALVGAQRTFGEAAECRILGRAGRYPAPSAAMCNAYQIHNGEYDCVHEAAVVHPMAVLLGAVCAYIDREAVLARRSVSGQELIAAVALGVDVAGHLGVACRSPLRFFRPATVGAFAATSALGKLAGFDRASLSDAMGIVYAQLCGTMQPHTEGSPLLAMQIGFNARNAIVALDMAAAGIPGLRDTLEGPFGFYANFEGENALAQVLQDVGRVWRITEVAHKPFPSGRATHGIVEACLSLKRRHGFDARDVAHVEARVPPLTLRLVGRHVMPQMEVNYARLSGPYVAARALLNGSLSGDDFTAAARTDHQTLALGERINVVSDDNPDPNALCPVTVVVTLNSGAVEQMTLATIYGHPSKPMARDAYLAKFRSNWRASREALAGEDCARAIALLETLEAVDDVCDVLQLFSA